MKLLFVGRYNNSEILSGPEKVSKRIYHEIKNKEIAVFIEYFFDGKEYNFFKKMIGYETVGDIKMRIYRLGMFKIIRFLLSYKPDIVHIINYERFSVIIYFLKPFLRYKICYNVHGIIRYEHDVNVRSGLSLLRLKDIICEKISINYSEKLFFLSDYSIELAKKYFKILNKKIVKIPNGIDTVFTNSLSVDKLMDSTLKIAFIGDSDRKEKGLGFLIDVIKMASFPVELNIIGKSSELYISQAKNELVKIRFYSKFATEEFASIIIKNDIFISASIFETFSISAIEAMACGVVPIVTRSTGMSEYISHGMNGFVYDYGDKLALLSVLNMLFSDRFYLKKLSINATKISRDLSWEKISAMYLKEYQDLLNDNNKNMPVFVNN